MKAPVYTSMDHRAFFSQNFTKDQHEITITNKSKKEFSNAYV